MPCSIPPMGNCQRAGSRQGLAGGEVQAAMDSPGGGREPAAMPATSRTHRVEGTPTLIVDGHYRVIGDDPRRPVAHPRRLIAMRTAPRAPLEPLLPRIDGRDHHEPAPCPTICSLLLSCWPACVKSAPPATRPPPRLPRASAADARGRHANTPPPPTRRRRCAARRKRRSSAGEDRRRQEPAAGRRRGYVTIRTASRSNPANGQVEVAEVFGYVCPACNMFQPTDAAPGRRSCRPTCASPTCRRSSAAVGRLRARLLRVRGDGPGAAHPRPAVQRDPHRPDPQGRARRAIGAGHRRVLRALRRRPAAVRLHHVEASRSTASCARPSSSPSRSRHRGARRR